MSCAHAANLVLLLYQTQWALGEVGLIENLLILRHAITRIAQGVLPN